MKLFGLCREKGGGCLVSVVSPFNQIRIDLHLFLLEKSLFNNLRGQCVHCFLFN